MGDCCGRDTYQATFSDRFARRMARRFRKRGLTRIQERLVGFLAEHGIVGATVLEIGGGARRRRNGTLPLRGKTLRRDPVERRCPLPASKMGNLNGRLATSLPVGQQADEPTWALENLRIDEVLVDGRLALCTPSL